MSNDEAEKVATLGAVLQFTQGMIGGKACRVVIELPADVDKHKVIYLGLLPLILADAAQHGRAVLWLAPDGNSEARAKNKWREFMILDPLGFGTWYSLEPIPDNGFQRTGLERFWVIGDLDWSDQPLGSYYGEAVVNAVERVLAADTCPTLLVHQQGKTPVVSYPPKFGSRCFIATVAFGENTQEVERLRHFRDGVLCSSPLGRWLIALYERVSPMVAEQIRPHERLRAIVRGAVIKPLSAAAALALSRLSTSKRKE